MLIALLLLVIAGLVGFIYWDYVALVLYVIVANVSHYWGRLTDQTP